MGIYEYKTRIEFCDIDINNRLSAKGLIRILGEIAGIHSESLGYGLNSMPQNHLTWMLLNWKIQFFLKPSWNSDLLVKTWARSFSKISSVILIGVCFSESINTHFEVAFATKLLSLS